MGGGNAGRSRSQERERKKVKAEEGRRVCVTKKKSSITSRGTDEKGTRHSPQPARTSQGVRRPRLQKAKERDGPVTKGKKDLLQKEPKKKICPWAKECEKDCHRMIINGRKKVF